MLASVRRQGENVSIAGSVNRDNFGATVPRKSDLSESRARTRRFRFGVSIIARLAASIDAWRDEVLRVESYGYSTVCLSDHVNDLQFASVPAIARAASFSSEMRFGTLVFNNDFRHPVMLAKEVATLDVMTGGRYEFGIGAGWMRDDYSSLNLRRDPGSVRVERLAEAIQVIKGCLACGRFDFQGKHYQLSGIEGWPQPVQVPFPPIVIGGGTREILTLAAREADVVSLNPVHRKGVRGQGPQLTASALAERAHWVRDAAGTRYGNLEINIVIRGVRVTDRVQDAAEEIGSRFDLTADEAMASPYLLIGSVDAISTRLHELRESYGASYFTIRDSDSAAMAPIIAKVSGR
jgi:probable F420-dependent oxidoreductase